MLDFLKNLLTPAPSADFKELVASGAVVLDVRTPGEYQGGHVRGAVNIPLQVLPNQLSKLDRSKTIITCCQSGMRSAQAKQILLEKGFANVHNGGGWSMLQHQIS